MVNAVLSSLLFAGAAFGHAGVKKLVIDGNVYAPFDSRIDVHLGQVKRIEWFHDKQAMMFNPVTNTSSPDMACRENSKPPLLTAKARAGSEVSFTWTPLTRMHMGPILTYLGRLPTPDTKPQDVEFFKIYEKGFDADRDRWANQIVTDDGESYRVQLPSDIKPGKYILRTEWIALHGNMKELKSAALKGEVQYYPYCFNVEISGTGTQEPKGVKFPGAYKKNDTSLTFAPYMTYNKEVSPNAIAINSQYKPPGPPKYAGQYKLPQGPVPIVPQSETGIYPAELNVKYQDLLHRIERPGLKMANYINTVWPYYQADDVLMGNYGKVAQAAGKESAEVLAQLMPELEAFKAESEAA